MKDIILISSGYDMFIRFWSEFSSNSQSKHAIEVKDRAINALEMSPSKEYVAFGAANSIRTIDMKGSTPQIKSFFDAHEGLVSSLLIPPNFEQCILSGGEDNTVRLSDLGCNKCVKTFYHSNFVNALAVTNDNKEVIAADEDGSIKIWDINKGEVRYEWNKKEINEEGAAFRSICVNEQQGILVAAKSSGQVMVFDYNPKVKETLVESSKFEAHRSYVTKCCISPNKNLLATCGADNEVRVWQRKYKDEMDEHKRDFELKSRLVGHKKWVWDCDFTLDSKLLLSCSSDRTIRIWDVDAAKSVRKMTLTKGVNNIILADEGS